MIKKQLCRNLFILIIDWNSIDGVQIKGVLEDELNFIIGVMHDAGA